MGSRNLTPSEKSDPLYVKKAVKWCQRAADLGHIDAMTSLGDRHKNGKEIEKDDKKAIE